MTITFTENITLPPNDEEILVQFEVSIVSGGFSYEFWGQKGFKSETEIDEIIFNEEGLAKEQIDHINKLIEDGRFDDKIWDEYNSRL